MIERSMMTRDTITLWNTAEIKFLGNEIYKKTETIFMIMQVRGPDGRVIPGAMVDVQITGELKDFK